MSESQFLSLLQQGMEFHQQGAISTAIDYYQRAYQIDPKHSQLNYLLGTIALHSDRFDTAEQLFKTALEGSNRKNEQSQCHEHLGLVYSARNEFKPAVDHLKKAVKNSRDPATIYCYLSSLYIQMSRWDMAEKNAKSALALEKNNVQALADLGLIYQQKGDYAQSSRQFNRVLKTQPTFLPSFNLAKNAQFVSSWKEAADHFEQALQYAGGDMAALTELVSEINTEQLTELAATAYSQLGVSYHQNDQLELAIKAFEKSCDLQPENALYLTNYATFLTLVDELESAQRIFEKSLSLDETMFATLFNYSKLLVKEGNGKDAIGILTDLIKSEENGDGRVEAALASIKTADGEFTEALDLFTQAIAKAPDNASYHYDKSITLLTVGDFGQAWPEYLWRIKDDTGYDYILDPSRLGMPGDRPQVLPSPRPLTGESISGQHFFLLKEQGLGDQIFFLRFVPELLERGAKVSLYIDPRLKAMMERTECFTSVVADQENRNASVPDGVNHIFAVGDLPLLCEHRELTPKAFPLKPLPRRVEALKAKLAEFGPGPYLGVAWRAGTARKKGGGDTVFKQLDLELMSQALQTWQGSIIVVQRNPAAGEVQQLETLLGKKVLDMSAVNQDLEETLALLEVLDEYAGTSNTNVHLRECLGKPSKVLMPNPCDWRWGEDPVAGKSVATHWSPNSQVFRQEISGDWSPALEALKQCLS